MFHIEIKLLITTVLCPNCELTIKNKLEEKVDYLKIKIKDKISVLEKTTVKVI